MIHAEITFWSNTIRDINIILPSPPSIGDSIKFPIGTVKNINGEELEDNCFRIYNIDWVLQKDSIITKYKFDRLLIYLECP